MPSLEWEENIFLGMKALYNAAFVSPIERNIRSRQALLVDQRAMLLILGKILSGKDIVIFETEDSLLYLSNRICLPSRIHIGPSQAVNFDCYILRTAVASIAMRFGLNNSNSDIDSLLECCCQELPEFSKRLMELEQNLSGRERLLDLFSNLPSVVQTVEPEGEQADIHMTEEDESVAVTEIQGEGRVTVTAVEEGETGEQDTPFHTFEKAETLEEYNGLSRQNDAEDELSDHQEALSKLKMDSVLRTSDRSQSVYKADIMLDGLAFELHKHPSAGIPYPEWDYKRRQYKNNWCFVHESSQDYCDSTWVQTAREKHSSLIITLKKKFAAVVTDWLKTKRQSMGDDFDLDAIIDLIVRLKNREPPLENLYIGKRRSLPNISTLILLDTSYSTDSWVQNRRILDVMKDTVLCLAEVLEEAQQKLGIYSFASNTRQSCKMTAIKRFDEKWQERASFLGGLEPVGYTRIGPALRHAYRSLFPLDAEKKLLILITDGKPCDYDRYEGQYGIEDVRKAITEGKEKGVVTHAFAIDKQAREYFPIMFSKMDYDIVTHPAKLVATLFQLYLKVMCAN